MSRKFKLNPELIDQIIFAMENQNKNFLLDSRSLLLVSEIPEEDEEEDAFISLPDWTPSDGYQLMDSFTGTLKNPIYRERLRKILNAGRGVFRGFKNVLKEREDLEKLWFAHKERVMKKRVNDWYAELCDLWGIESLGEEPEDTEDLFLDEFSMEEFSPGPDVLAGIARDMSGEFYLNYPEPLKKLLLEPFISLAESSFEKNIRALSSEGMDCGMISISGDGDFAFIRILFVQPEFRGAGIAAGLLNRACSTCYDDGIQTLFISLPPEGEILKSSLLRRGFQAAGPWLALDLESWFYAQKENY